MRLLVAALRRRLLLILVIVLACGLAGFLYAQSDKGEYQATAQLLLDPTAVVVPGAQAFTGDPERFVGGQIGVLRSRATAERAAEAIAVTADEVGETLVVERLVGSDVVDVIGRAEEAELARDVANAVAESYVAQRREQSVATVEAQLSAVDEEIAAVEAQLEELPVTVGQPSPAQQVIVDQYDQLLQRRLDLTAPGAVRDATAVLDPARLPETPQRLSPLLAGLAGCVVGLLLGTALAVLLEGRRPFVTSRSQAEHLLGRPIRTTFPAGRRRGELGPAERQAARLLLGLVRTHPVQGRRVIAVCATGASSTPDRLAAALVDVEAERGAAAELVPLAGLRTALPSGAASVGSTGHGRRGDGHEELSSLAVDWPPDWNGSSLQADPDRTVRDADVTVLVLPHVLDDPSAADVARWATDIVLVVSLGGQSESDLATAQELLASGTARLHPVVVNRRVRVRG